MNKNKQTQKHVGNGKSNAAMHTEPNLKKERALSLLIVFSIPVLLYLQTLSFGYIHFDDDFIINNNKDFLRTFSNLPHAFATDAFGGKISSFYRPLQTVSYMFDVLISSANSQWMFHLSNVLLLGFIACALYLFLLRFLIPQRFALFGTLLFCVHPLFVSSVAWIPARGDLLVTLFALLSVVCLIDYLDKRNILLLIAHLLTFFLTLFCKETAAVLPVIFMLYFVLFAKSKKVNAIEIAIVLFYAVAGIAWFVLRLKAIGGFSTEDSVVGIVALQANLQTIPTCLALFFVPYNLAPIPSFSVIRTVLGVIIIAVIIVLFFINKEKSHKQNLFCLAWFALFLVPLMVYKHPYIDYLNHRFMLPLIGMLLFALSMIPKHVVQQNSNKHTWIFIAVLVSFGLISFINTKAYANPIAYYNEAVRQNTHSVIPYNNRGILKRDAGDNRGAIEDFTAAIAVNPRYTLAFYNRAKAKNNSGDKHGAIDDYTKALTISPLYFEAYYNRANVKNDIGDSKGAIDDYAQAITLNPTCAEVYDNRGSAQAKTGDKQAAINDYTKAITLHQNYAEAYNDRANAKAAIHDTLGAINDYKQAIVLRQNYAEAYYNFGVYLCMIGKFEQAIAITTKAIESEPTAIAAYRNRAIAKYSIKDYVGAISDCNIVLQRNPNDERTRSIAYFAQQAIGK